ncbi:unnamed protein product, partial [marine sediment metagenome]
SKATNLNAGDTDGLSDIYIHDRDADEDGVFDETGLLDTALVLVSVDSNGNKGNGDSISSSMSSDGRYVVFESKATNLDAGDTDGLSDIYIHDRDADEDGVFDETGLLFLLRFLLR